MVATRLARHVPTISSPSPGSVTPAPSAHAGRSYGPFAIRVPAGSPSPRVSAVATGSATGASSPRRRVSPSSSTTPLSYDRVLGSRNGIEASETSVVARAPVSRWNTMSLQYSAVAAASSDRGSCAASQASSGPGQPVNIALPVRRNTVSKVPSASHRSSSSCARPSIQDAAARTGRPSASTSHTPSPCPVSPASSTVPSTPAVSSSSTATTAP